MKGIRFVLLGIVFGVVMTKSEAISWYRIQEMFRFQSFHMYGVIGVAVLCGILIVQTIKKFKLKDIHGAPILIPDKRKGWKNYLLGGTIFGLGWALTGACPGPIFVNLGYGFLSFLIVIAGALLGTFFYGVLRSKLPQ